MRELKLKRCNSCGALVKVIRDCHCRCDIMCCDNKMEEVEVNTKNSFFEKHLPVYKENGDMIEVKVNHAMDEDHYIEWLCLVTDDSEEYVYFNPGDEAKATFPKKKGILYSYCNKHGLFKVELS